MEKKFKHQHFSNNDGNIREININQKLYILDEKFLNEE